MVNVYVAGYGLERASKVMEELRSNGYGIAYDWVGDFTSNDAAEEDKMAVALKEREAVRAADALVYLWEPPQESARYEAGMAMGLGKPIIAVGHKAFFFLLPEVACIDSDEAIVPELRKIFLRTE